MGNVSLRSGICRCSYFNYYIHCATYIFVIAGLCTWYGQYIKETTQFLVGALRTLYFMRVWGMVEVFLIGILVTLVKLMGMVLVIPEIALWAFAVLSLLMVYITSVKVSDIWNEIDRSQPWQK